MRARSNSATMPASVVGAPPLAVGAGVGREGDAVGEEVLGDRLAVVAQQHGALHLVLQLADVAGPVVAR